MVYEMNQIVTINYVNLFVYQKEHLEHFVFQRVSQSELIDSI